jgi:thioredoxin-related protein
MNQRFIWLQYKSIAFTILYMKSPKSSYIFAGLTAFALILVLASARKPLPATAPKSISWLTIDEVPAKLKEQPKPILIDLYTTWCGWCKQMDHRTYSNKKVIQYLGDKFYTVRLDAETHNTITWQGRTYQFDPQYRCNMFAVYLSHGQLEFPTTIIIAPGQEPQAIPGFMEPKAIEPLVKYFGEGEYKSRGFDEYAKNFRSSW